MESLRSADEPLGGIEMVVDDDDGTAPPIP